MTATHHLGINKPQRDDIDTSAPDSEPGSASAPVPAPTLQNSLAGAGQVLYLPPSGRIVVLYEHIVPNWWCLLLADPAGSTPAGSMVRVTDGQVLTALRVPLGDPAERLPAQTFVQVWLAQVAASGGDSRRNLIARTVATRMRIPDRRAVIVGHAARRQLADLPDVGDPDVDRILTELIIDGFLHVVPSLVPTGQAAFRLALRYTPWIVPDDAGQPDR